MVKRTRTKIAHPGSVAPYHLFFAVAVTGDRDESISNPTGQADLGLANHHSVPVNQLHVGYPAGPGGFTTAPFRTVNGKPDSIAGQVEVPVQVHENILFKNLGMTKQGTGQEGQDQEGSNIFTGQVQWLSQLSGQ